MQQYKGPGQPLRVLELYAGSRSVGSICDRLRYPCWSVDIEPFPGINQVVDIRAFNLEDLPWRPTFVWASPPCTSYSICGIRYHRNGIEPTSETARIGDQLLAKTLQIVDALQVPYVIENPVGMMRLMPMLKDRPRQWVTYCKYGDHRMKPTDLWSNMFRSLFLPHGWTPAPPCYNGNPHCHHDRQPRTYAKRKAMGVHKLGTTGLNSAYDRSKVPSPLIESALQYAHRCALAGITSINP